jgi:hypothetical protein
VKIAALSADTFAAMAARYETLRAAAFGDGLPPEARSGLTLFLRRGMWGWARALTVTSRVFQEQTFPSSAPLSLTDDGRSSVVRLLAAIAMGSNDDRRSP